jgi:hypothetical protein
MAKATKEAADKAATTCPSCARDKSEAKERATRSKVQLTCPCGYVWESKDRPKDE